MPRAEPLSIDHAGDIGGCAGLRYHRRWWRASDQRRIARSVVAGARASPSEAAVIAAASLGEPNAFRSLTDPYVRELHVHCYRLLGSVHDADDAMQETLLRAWRRLPDYEPRAPLAGRLPPIAAT